MLSSDEIGELVAEMVQLRLEDEREHLTDILHDLVTGPRIDALNVLLVLSGIVATDLGDDPQQGFHEMTVTREDGTPASSRDLPDQVATFLQMVVAIANNDRAMARDLFLAHVGNSGSRALSLLIFALNSVMHQNELCPFCDLPEGGVVTWTD